MSKHLSVNVSDELYEEVDANRRGDEHINDTVRRSLVIACLVDTCECGSRWPVGLLTGVSCVIAQGVRHSGAACHPLTKTQRKALGIRKPKKKLTVGDVVEKLRVVG